MKRVPFICGNWKLNKTIDEAVALARAVSEGTTGVTGVEVGVAPVATALHPVSQVLKGSHVLLGGQNCYPEPSGAYTGELSPAFLKDAGCQLAIVGHSERRQYFAESDAFINRKVRAVLAEGLTPILCIGETLEEREQNRTFDVVGKQLDGGLAGIDDADLPRLVLAYEPVWAIGTGKTATKEQAQEVHAFIRGRLAERSAAAATAVRIQYGGSVKPSNARELLAQPDIDGALVGGASLKADDFIAIVGAALPS